MARFTSSAQHVLELALEEARGLHHSRVGAEHLLLGLIRNGQSQAAYVLNSVGVSLENARQQVSERASRQNEEPSNQMIFTSQAQAVLDLSGSEAFRHGEEYITTERILLALIQEGQGVVAQLLVALGAEISTIRKKVLQHSSATMRDEEPGSVVLDEFGQNLTRSATRRELETVVGRDREVGEVMQVLSRRIKSNPVIIGEPGIGKASIVNGLAEAIIHGDVPSSIVNMQLYKLDVDKLTSTENDIEANLNSIFAEIQSRTDIILFIDEIHVLLSESTLMRQFNFAERLISTLAGGGSRIIGATTLDDYRGRIEPIPALHQHFMQVPVNELSVPATIDSLKIIRDRLEAHYRVSITNGALNAAAKLARRHLRNQVLPGSAIELLDKAGARQNLRRTTPPLHLQEIDREIAAIKTQKESQIDACNFEAAAVLRDAEQKLHDKRSKKHGIWKIDDFKTPVILDEDDIVEVVALETGIPYKQVFDSLRPRRQEHGPLQLNNTPTYVLLGDQPVKNVNDDLLGAAETGKTIAEIISDSRASSPFVMAIDGGWGMGKSTLLHQISSHLSGDADVTVVHFNAWTSQGDRALEGLIKSVLGSLDRSSLRRGLRRVSEQRHAWVFVRIFLGVAARFVGATKLIDELWNQLEVDAKGRNELRSAIFDMLSNWTSKGESAAGKSLVVIIDDLDRCSDQIIIQICEAVKLYLDAPGLIFVIGCDYSVLQHGISVSDRGNEARIYLEKIIQVVHRLQPPNEAEVLSLVQGYAQGSGTKAIIDQSVEEILSRRAGRNPRRIKRIFNSFVMESRLNRAWSSPELGNDQLVKVVIIHHLYSSFYDELISDRSGADPIGDFLDYAEVKGRAADPPALDDAWWSLVGRLFRRHDVLPPPRSTTEHAELSSALAALERTLPSEYPAQARDIAFISLLRGVGDDQARAALTSLLRNEPLQTENFQT